MKSDLRVKPLLIHCTQKFYLSEYFVLSQNIFEGFTTLMELVISFSIMDLLLLVFG